MGASHPGEASKLFEERFAAGDLDGLMDLYEDGAVFTNAQGAHEGPDAIRAVLAGYVSTGASIAMNESVAFEAGELALVHWAWTMRFPDERVGSGDLARIAMARSVALRSEPMTRVDPIVHRVKPVSNEWWGTHARRGRTSTDRGSRNRTHAAL